MPATNAERAELLALLEEQYLRRSRRYIDQMYPDADMIGLDGKVFHSRHKYPRHMEFFEAGATYRERLARCANRIGKSLGMGGYESALHLTGDYPDWWSGKRFTKPVRWWAAGKTSETTRDIVQTVLMGTAIGGAGSKSFSGTGLVPFDRIGRITWKSGVADLADTVQVQHKSGGWSTLGLKTYHQGRGSFEGTEQEGIWFDEEPPIDVYGEALIRTATTDGLLMITFTPLDGMSKVVRQFMPAQQIPGYTQER